MNLEVLFFGGQGSGGSVAEVLQTFWVQIEGL